MVTFLAVLLMAFTFRNLIGLLESAIMLRTSMRQINVEQPNFFSGAIGIINFEKPFLNFMRQSACLFFKPIMVDNYAAFFNCTPVGQAPDSMMSPT